MIIACPECQKSISDKALQCPSCGFPMQKGINAPPAPNSAPKRRNSSKALRLPNGFGQIRKLTGRRRCPFAAYPPTKDYKLNGQAIPNKALGYFPSYNDAYQALIEYNKNPYDVDARSATFAEVYEMFYADKFNGKKEYSNALRKSYTAAFKNSADLHDRSFRSLRSEDFQAVIDNCTLKHASLELIVNLFKQMSKFALVHDIIDKNYAQFARVNVADDDEHGEPFTSAEMGVLWRNTGDPAVRQILIMCYTGFRVSAYKTIKIENDCFVGGVKGSKDRMVPLHPAVRSWADQIVGKDDDAIRKSMRSCLKDLGISDHTPHDCRHTFSWLLTSSGCDDFTRHLLLGHKIQGDTEAKVYTHRTIQELRKAVERCHTFVT